jgi:hypothetical protein
MPCGGRDYGERTFLAFVVLVDGLWMSGDSLIRANHRARGSISRSRQFLQSLEGCVRAAYSRMLAPLNPLVVGFSGIVALACSCR